ncbi:WD40-repeat-containing domain protein [Crepidotus variabilis]|uniref:WD40-repeat-containing domain protein n=1 Tax=Crepidotus variabilis TaxID=179855 RepID=A0A9P6EF43_9AGAR|nr:WD40-repeat-containing domain protein [Crepidotus variabilis]
MVKNPRKRQKISDRYDPASSKEAKLSKLLDDENKDEEERRLESLLFGKKYEPKVQEKGKSRQAESGEDTTTDESDDDNAAVGGGGMRHLLDQDLFFVDDTAANGSSSMAFQATGSHSELEDTDSGSGSSSSSWSTPSLPSGQGPLYSKSITASGSKPPAWVDPADTQPTKVSLLGGASRLRKLRHAVDEDEITGREYETRLRDKFERLNPEPAWSKNFRNSKRRKTAGGRDDEDLGEARDLEEDGDPEGLETLVSSSHGILKERRKRIVALPRGTIALERVRDANHSTQCSTSGEVKVVSFHPKPAVPVLCVATSDRRVSLFHIDGHLSPLLTTLHVPSLPVLSDSSVLYHPSGNSLLISGPRPFFYTYDLQQGTSTLHRRGLWGTGFDDSSILTPSNLQKRRRRNGQAGNTTGGGGSGGGGNTESISHASFSPGTGSMLAVAGKGGNVHLVDWKSGAGQVIGNLRCSSSGGGGGGGIKGLWWIPSSTVNGEVLGDRTGCIDEEKHLAVLTGEAEVYIWDVGQRRCVRRWKDEGGYRGAGRVLAGSNGWIAIGSTSGFVNIYGSDAMATPSIDDTHSTGRNPKLLKALGQLTTPISTLKFNHDSQILAMASKDKKDALRLVHLPSLTAFGNWPTSSTPLGHVTAVDFAARSEYVAVGNSRGKVLLYHLKDYGA